MPIISFKSTLIDKVIDGSKPHTIRFGKRIYKVGQPAIHATGVRTAKYKEHRRDQITAVDKIRILIKGYALKIWINDQLLNSAAAHKLVRNDGFNTLGEFTSFFLKKSDYFNMTGQLIHWAKSPINYNQI